MSDLKFTKQADFKYFNKDWCCLNEFKTATEQKVLRLITACNALWHTNSSFMEDCSCRPNAQHFLEYTDILLATFSNYSILSELYACIFWCERFGRNTATQT